MALSEYKQKRSLNKSPEPTGGRSSANKLVFVVQKHAASHLHYDFRLEMRGVLKSWAVPKGPSINQKDRRLAMAVEDHPFDYKDFEGIIPQGNYGAGTVIVWDHGDYEPAEKLKDKKSREHALLKDYYSGSLKIILHGHKLKGAFSLVRDANRGENAWLLTKIKDQYASAIDVTLQDKSVISKKTIEQLQGSIDADRWERNRSSNGQLKKGKKTKFPSRAQPMLATLTEGVINDDRYAYEIKWDGYRIMSFVNHGKVRLDSRGGKDYTSKYPPIIDALKGLGHDMVLDGEMVVFDKEGRPSFNAVQLYNGHDSPISYYVFDILWLDGYSLTDLPLTERKAILKDLVAESETIAFSDSFDDGEGLYDVMKEKGWEGIVAKRKDSPYLENDRSSLWLKMPVKKVDEFVIGGWAESDKARSFRSLLFGAYSEGKLKWVGRSGSGFKEKDMPAILKELSRREIPASPFVNRVLDDKGATLHWVRPELVANFEYAEMTETGRIRKPATWKGFRLDKKAEQVMVPVAKPLPAATPQEPDEQDATKHAVPTTVAKSPPRKKTSRKPPAKHKYLNADSGWERVDAEQKNAEWSDFEMDNCTIAVHNLERDIWEDVSKGRLLIYYSEMASTILPYIHARPQSLNLKLTHAGGPKTFIKDMENRQPSCAEVFTDKRRVKKSGKRATIDYLVCNNRETLIFLVDLGCVDVNTWASTTDRIEEPTYLWLDLDPTISEGLKNDELKAKEDEGFAKAIEVALACKKTLDKHKLTGFVKTSGKTGLHIYIPCSGFNFTQTRAIAAKLADEANQLVPKISTRNESISQRDEAVYIDAGQNDYADTLAAPYCVRPYHTPLVSTPLEWKEIRRGLNRHAFTIHTIQDRLEKKGDLWKKLSDKKITAANNRILKGL